MVLYVFLFTLATRVSRTSGDMFDDDVIKERPYLSQTLSYGSLGSERAELDNVSVSSLPDDDSRLAVTIANPAVI